MNSRSRKGYPERYWKSHDRVWRWGVSAILVTGSVATVFTYLAIRDQGPLWTVVVSLGVFLWILLGTSIALWEYTFHVSIHPYFERRVGDIDTFAQVTRWRRR